MLCQLGNTYSYNGLMRAIDIYNFHLGNSYYLICLSYRYILQYGFNYKKSPLRTDVFKNIHTYFITLITKNKTPEIAETLAELTDIMLEFNPLLGREMLSALRNYNIIIPETKIQQPLPINEQIKIKSVYEDSQNVHNSTINQNVKNCALYLHKISTSDQKLPDFISVKTHFESLFGFYPKVFKRIETDNATYNIGINLQTIFLCVWVWINKHPSQDELLIRMNQEFTEMEGYCSTGFLSRLINIIQGYTEDENLIIKISNYDQHKAVIKHYLDTILSENPNMLDEMLDKTKTFISFILKNIDKNIDKWKLDYGIELELNMKKIINDYTNIQIFTI